MVKDGLEFRIVPEAEARTSWDAWLSRFEDSHIRQSARWAELKSAAWTPVFTGLFHGPTPTVMAMVLLKKFPLGGRLAWINGGPVHRRGRPPKEQHGMLRRFLENLRDELLPGAASMLRIAPAIPMDVDAQLANRQIGFKRPLAALDTGLTYIVDLTQDEKSLHEGLERNWRNQLRSAEKATPKIEYGRSSDLFKRYRLIHAELGARKGLPIPGLVELSRMTEILGESVEFSLYSVGGADACGGAVWSFGDGAWFALSAANEAGRRAYLPNLMYWNWILRLKEKGLRRFDLTGIDPEANWGVYNFKRGLGLNPVETLGEWEWSRSKAAQLLFNAAIRIKGAA